MPDIIAPKPAPGAPIESAWGGEIHDGIEGIQTGEVQVNLGGAPQAAVSVTFPRPYVEPPKVAITIAWESGDPNCIAMTNGLPSATALGIRIATASGGSSSSTLRAHWIAVGKLA